MKITESDIASKNVFHGKLIDLNINTIKLPNGKLAQREIVHHPASCGALVVNDEQEILLVSQWRAPIKTVSLEIPAGLIDKTDPTPQAAIQRELNEETGFKANYWKRLAKVYTSPGFTDEIVYLYYCKDITRLSKKATLDKDEFLNSNWYSYQDVISLIKQHKITDLKTCYAISMFFNMQNAK